MTEHRDGTERGGVSEGVWVEEFEEGEYGAFLIGSGPVGLVGYGDTPEEARASLQAALDEARRA